MKTLAAILALSQLLIAQTPSPSQPAISDPAGNLYLAGSGWVEKLGPDHETIVWRTDYTPSVTALAVDSAGNLYSGGVSGPAGFLAIFNPEGKLVSSTPVENPVTALALDATGSVYLGGPGYVAKVGGGSVTALGLVRSLAIDTNGFVFAGGDGFVAKLTKDGSRWDWTYWLGAQPAVSQVRALELAGDGGIYAAGETSSPFLPVKNPNQALLRGPVDGFVMRLTGDGQLVWSTYTAKGSGPAPDLLTIDGLGNVVFGANRVSPDGQTAIQAPVHAAALAPRSLTPTTVSVDGFLASGTYGSIVEIRGEVSTSSGLAESATGTIAFYDGATLLAHLPVSSALAAYYTTGLAPGVHHLWTRYSGDGTYSGSVSGKSTYTVNAVTTTGFSSGPSIGNTNPYYVATFDYSPASTRTTKYAAVVDRAANSVSVYSVNPATVVWTLFGTWSVGNSPTSIAVADFNGDGYPDLAVANSSDATFTVLLGTHDLNYNLNGFSTYETIPFFLGNPQHIAAADFNGDGIPDLVLTDQENNTVQTFLGQGNGNFTLKASCTVGTAPWFTAVADLNGDGIPDLAVSNGGSGNLTILLGNGDGTFAAGMGSPLTVGSSARSIAVGDFNGDGKPDLAVANYNDNTVTIYLQNSAGTGFTQQANVTLPSGANPWSVVTTDFNGDGKADLIVAGYSSGAIYTFTGNGNGTFTAGPGSPFTVNAGPASLALGDFDQNGTVDVVASAANGSGLSVLLGTSTVAKTATSIAMTAQSGSSFSNSTYGSAVNLSYVVTPSAGNGSVTFYDGAAVLATYPGAVYSLTPGTHSLTARYNGDSSHAPSVSPAVTFTVTPAAEAGLVPAATAADNGAYFVAPATFNGSPGFVSVNRSANTVKAWTTNATASATLYGSASTGNSPTSAAVADFNGDGNPDIAVTNSGDNTITVLLGNNSGGFTQAPGSPIAVGGQPQYVASGDFNGDGIVDLAVANFQSTSNSVTILLGVGDGTFYQAVGSPVAVGSNPWFIAVTDFNGDGKADLAVSNGSSGSVTVLLGNGNGTFTAGLGSPLSVGSSARSIAVADFNGDGRPDMAVASYNDNTVSILVQNSGGTGFTAMPTIALPAGTNPWTVVTSDFNADGKADLAVTGFTSNKIYIYLGNGDGTFTQATNSPVAAGSGPGSLIVEDFNKDGRPDLAIADQSGTVTILDGSVSVAVSLNSAPNPSRLGQAVSFNVAANPLPSTSAPFLILDGMVPVVAGNTGQIGTTGFSSTLLGSGARSLRTSLFNPSPFYLPAYAKTTQIVNANPIAGFVQQTSGAGTSPQNAAIGDFNGDGIPDYATSNQGSNNISVYLGNGAGGFTQASGSPISDSHSPQTVVAGDFNNDGKQDIAVANTDGSLTVLLGNGNGTFTAAANASSNAGTTPVGLAVGDFNNDGIEDLAVANSGSAGTVTILLGDGTGKFTATGTPVSTGAYSSNLAIADFNGDGNADLVVSNGGETSVSVLLGNGQGGFSSAKVTAADGANTVAVADFDADGIPDIAVAGNTGITLFRGNGAGSFTEFPNGKFTAGTNNFPLVVMDFNGDGKPDLAFAANQLSLIVLLNTSSGAGSASFVAAPYSPIATPNGPNSILAADLNGDGAPDLLLANTYNGVGVWLGAGQSTVSLAASPNPSAYGSQIALTATVTPSNAAGFVTFYDGINVLGSASISGGTANLNTSQLTSGAHSLTTYYPGNSTTLASSSSALTQTVSAVSSTGTFVSGSSGPADADAYQVVSADINGDGKADLVAVNRSANMVAVWLGNGSGGFTQAAGSPYSVGSSPTAAVVADFNRDGRPDIAVTNSGSNNLTILLQNANGTFTAASGSPIAAGGQPQYVASGDFNGDGIPDLAVANFQSSSDSVTILLGNGDGTFRQASGSPIAVGTNPWFIAVADFNGDGKADLAVSNGSSANVDIFLGNGDGTFTIGMGSPLSAGSSARSIATGYFNADGKLDFAVSNYNDNTIDVYLQNSAGAGFTAAPTIMLPSGTNPWTLISGDFNGDGKADLAVAGYGSNQVFVFLGNGDGTFSAAPGSPFATGSGPGSLAAGNFTGNGVLSLAVANQSGSGITLLAGSIATVTTLTTNGSVATASVSPVPSGGKITLYDGTTVYGILPANNGQATFTIYGLLPAGVNSLRARYDGSGQYLSSLSAAVSVTRTPTASSTFSAVISASAATSIGANFVEADMNGDGKPDLVAVSASSNTVSILLNTGSGASRFTQAPGSPYNIGNRAMSYINAVPTSVAVGDFNGDGRPDIAVTGSLDGSVTILLQNADGSYSSTWNNLPYITGLNGIAAGDFNNDGIVDLAITRPGVLGGPGSLFIAQGNGDGTFVFNQTTYSTVGNSPGVPTIADFNGDGNADVAVPNSDGTITILLGQGNGLTAPGFGGTLTAGSALNTLAVADLNGDGHPDLAAAGGANGMITVYLGNSTATGFRTPTTVALANGANALGLAATDFNGDGVMDLAAFVTGTTGNYVTQLIGAGTGAFTAGPSAMTVFAAGPVCVADWNGDGRMDVAGLPSNGPAFVVDGAVPFPMTFSVSPSSSSLGNPVTLSVSPDAGVHGAATFYDGTNILGTVPTLTTGNSISLTTTELASGSHQLSASWPGDENTPPQTFAPVAFTVAPGQSGTAAPTQISVNGQYINSGDSLASADVNKDGVLDLIVIHTGTSLIDVYLGSKSGTFSEAPGSPISVSSPTFAAAADFNGDGIPDMAVLSAGGGYTVWFGDGTGRFTQSGGVRPTVDTQPNSIVVTDFNRDGRADLAITNYLDSSVSILLGDGAGNFGNAPGSPKKGSLIGPGPMAVADFNLDGYPDLVIASTAGNLPNNPMPIFYGSATGAMTAPNPNSVFQLAFVPTGIAVGDFNKDGIPDVAVAYTVYESDGSVSIDSHASLDAYLCCSAQQFFYSTLVEQGNFGQDDGDVDFFPEPYTTSAQPGNLVVLDYAGAGNADIATPVGLTTDASNPAYDALTVYLNQPALPPTSLYPPNLFPVVQTYTGNVGSGPTTPPTVISGDFNGDGLIDLIVSSPNNGTISFLPGVTQSYAAKVAFTTPPPSTGAVAGTALPSVVVQVQDPFGRLVTGSSATVTLTATPQNPSSGATATAVNGIATFDNLVFNTPGTYSVTATSSGLNSSAGYPLTVSGLPTQLAFSTAPPTTATRAVTLPQIVVQLKDVNANPVPESLGVTITSSPAGIAGTTVVNSNSTGAATFTNLNFGAPGTYTLTASAPGLTSVTSGSITVAAGPATQLALTGVASSAMVTSPLPSFTAQVEDAGGFVAPTATGTVTLSSSPAGISGTTTATLSGGAATFSNVSFSTPGTYTLTATWSGGFSVQTSITMGTGPASKLLFITQPPATVTAASALSAVAVKVTDSLGNTITGSSAAVTIASSPSGAVLGTLTVNAVNGVATFNNLTIDAPGTYTLAASSSGLTAANSTSFTVTAGSASKLLFTTVPPVTATPGQTFSAVVQVQDSVGNLVTSSSAPVTMQSSPTGLGGTVAVNAVNGVATFSNLSITAIGGYTLTATSPGLTSASSSMSIGAGTPAKLAFTSLPTAVTLGQAFTASVQLQDAGGNATTNWPNPVQLVVISASQPGVGGVLGANTLAATATASFGNLTINEPGTYTLTATLPNPFGLPTIANADSAAIVATSPVTLNVSPAGGSAFGAPVTLIATVTPSTATGKVTFYDGATPIGTAALSGGTATFTTTQLASGARKLRARYTGDSNNAASPSGSALYTVSAAPSAGPVAEPALAMPSSVQSSNPQLFPGSIASADFNGDGIADLAILDPGQDTLTVWLGNGRGGYTAASGGPYTLSNSIYPPNCLAVADFNLDGFADIAVASNGKLFLLLGNGSGGFSLAPPYGLSTNAITMAVGDFNNDGRPDLAVAGTANVAIMLGNASGGFTEAANSPLSAASSYSTSLCGSAGVCTATVGGATALAVADLNLDGNADLVLANGGVLTVLLGDGFGNFSISMKGGGVDTYVPSIAVADFNGDHIPDLALSGDGSNAVQILTGNGTGAFSTGNTYSLPSVPSQVLAADVDGDGIADLAFGFAYTQASGNSVYFLKGAGNGTFTLPAWKQINLGAGGQQPWAMTALNANGDGRTSIATLNALSGNESVSIVAGSSSLTVQSAHAGNFGQGQTGAQYALTVTNNGTAANSGSVTVTDTVPAGMTVTAMAGTGWTCATLPVCTRTDTLAGGSSYPALIVTVNVAANAPASLTNTATLLVGALTTSTATDPTAIYGAATQLVFTTQPPVAGVTGLIASAAVSVEDANGLVVANSAVPVSIVSNPFGVSGTLTANAVNGVATFTNLVFNIHGTYTLAAGATGLTGATSTAISVIGTDKSANNATHLSIATQPSTGQAGTPLTFVVQELTATGTVASSAVDAITVTSSPAGVTGTLTMNAVNGVAAFSNLVFPASGTYTLSASAAGLTGVTGSTIVIAPATSAVTLASSPAGLLLSVDGGTPQAAPFTVSLTTGTHTIAAAAQSGAPGTQYVFSAWSDSGAAAHSITVGSSPATYTATFLTQYQLATAASPAAGGTVTPAGGAFYNAGTVVTVQAAANAGYQFAGFSGGSLTGAANPQNVTLNGPVTVVANFTPLAPNIAASVGTRTVSGGNVLVGLTLTNTGLGTATNATITSITAITDVAGSGAVTVASGLPLSLGAIGSGASASGAVTLAWPSTATRVSFVVNFTADGGYSGSSKITTLY